MSDCKWVWVYEVAFSGYGEMEGQTRHLSGFTESENDVWFWVHGEVYQHMRDGFHMTSLKVDRMLEVDMRRLESDEAQ